MGYIITAGSYKGHNTPHMECGNAGFDSRLSAEFLIFIKYGREYESYSYCAGSYE